MELVVEIDVFEQVDWAVVDWRQALRPQSRLNHKRLAFLSEC